MVSNRPGFTFGRLGGRRVPAQLALAWPELWPGVSLPRWRLPGRISSDLTPVAAAEGLGSVCR